MASVNKVILIGNLGRDPEVRYTPAGSAVATVSIATTRQWKDKSGEKREETEWHRVVFYERLAEIAGEYLKKGRPVYIEGRLKYGKYTDKEGVERYTTDIIVTEMQLLGGRDEAEKPGNASSHAPRQPASQPPVRASGGGESGGEIDDDIPFVAPHFAADPMGRRLDRRMARYGLSIARARGQF